MTPKTYAPTFRAALSLPRPPVLLGRGMMPGGRATAGQGGNVTGRQRHPSFPLPLPRRHGRHGIGTARAATSAGNGNGKAAATGTATPPA